MDTLHIPHADIEAEVTMSTTTGLIRKVVRGILAPYQMVWFLVEFNIINATIWSDLFFYKHKNCSKTYKIMMHNFKK
jgi:hypothetical protein